MVLDRSLAEVEGFRNLSVGRTRSHQPQHSSFTIAQRKVGGSAAAGLRVACANQARERGGDKL